MALWFRQRLAALTSLKASSYLRRTRHEELSHSRSASFPDPFHLIVAGLHDSTNALLGWTDAPAPAQAGIAWIGNGMDHLNRLLAGLTDLLHHPQVLVQDPQRRRSKTAMSWTELLLHDLVLLADAHGCFCDVLLSLKQLLADAQAAVRHRDAARLTDALRVRGRSDRGLSRLASTLHGLSHRSSPSVVPTTALAEAVVAATCAAAATSAAIFAGLASASSSPALRALTSPADASPAKAMEGLQSLEDCVVAAEDGSEQVHRALVNATVLLLNVLTPC